MSTATLPSFTLPQIEKLRPRPSIIGRRWREEALRYDMAARAIREHWDDIPYQSRLALFKLCDNLDQRYPKPHGFLQWLVFIFLVPFAVGGILWSMARGQDDMVRWAMSLASLRAAIEIKKTQESETDAKLWAEETERDPEFLEAVKIGHAALARRELVKVNWETFQSTD